MSSPERISFPLAFQPPESPESHLGSSNDRIVLLEARFDTSSLNDKSLLSRFDTIQLKTTTNGEYRTAGDPETDGDREIFTWFNIALHRPGDQSAPRPRPRPNFTDGGSLCWRSHSNRQKGWDRENKFEGRIFSQDDELVKQLEYGDFIVVTLCARPVPAVGEYNIAGELVVTLLDQEIDRELASYGRYRFWARGPRPVLSYDHIVQSEIWFSTDALTKETISKLDTVQLFTESRDQGFVSDARTASYTWFDLVVLSSPGDQQPRVEQGLELAWHSHTNSTADSDFAVLEGTIFTSKHDLFRLLEVGNAIAVRVSSRFLNWENQANDGCLELRFSVKDIKRGKAVAQKSLVQAAEIQQKLMEYLDKNINIRTGPQTLTLELDPFVLEMLKKRPTWDQVGAQEKPELMLLSLDGGGVRGLLALHTLQALMERIRADRNLAKTPKPCEVFDLIVGTSTGGLIALMLARLEMSVEECIREYQELAIEVFGQKNVERYEGFWGSVLKIADDATKTYDAAINNEMYDASKLENAIRKVVQKADKNHNPDAEMWADTKCRAVVIASRADDVSTIPPTHFRTYWMDNKASPNCKIWEAARATSAAPAYFRRIQIGEYSYVDGGLQANNPVIQTLSESMIVYDDPRPVGCLISLGTGMPGPQALADRKGFLSGLYNTWSLGKAILHQLTNAQEEHDKVEGLNHNAKLAKMYRRFNAPINTLLPDTKTENKYVGLDDTSLIPKFKKAAEDYLKEQNPQNWLMECAQTLGKRLDGPKA